MSGNPDDEFLTDIARRAVLAAKFDECGTPEAKQAAKERAHRFAQEELGILRLEHMRDRLEEIVKDEIQKALRGKV